MPRVTLDPVRVAGRPLHPRDAWIQKGRGKSGELAHGSGKVAASLYSRLFLRRTTPIRHQFGTQRSGQRATCAPAKGSGSPTAKTRRVKRGSAKSQAQSNPFRRGRIGTKQCSGRGGGDACRSTFHVKLVVARTASPKLCARLKFCFQRGDVENAKRTASSYISGRQGSWGISVSE